MAKTGWTHRDVLRQAHPRATGELATVLDYITHGWKGEGQEQVPSVIAQYEAVKAGEMKPEEATALNWEMMPTDALKNPAVWVNLMNAWHLPYTALLRNLGRMTSIGAFDNPATVGHAVQRLSNPEYVRISRVHPFNILTALKTYSSGGGFRGSLTWTPKQAIVDALNDAFYAAFSNVQSTGKRTCVALDVSGSMTVPLMNSNVTAREGSVAMAMATVAADPLTTETIAFTHDGWTLERSQSRWGWNSGITEVGLSPKRRLDDVVRETSRLRMGATDCALPMIWAKAQDKVFDAFVVYTDSETWAGKVQPMDALRDYRRTVNPEARLVVVGMAATEFTIADPEDAGSMDVVGFDASAPATLANFISGKF